MGMQTTVMLKIDTKCKYHKAGWRRQQIANLAHSETDRSAAKPLKALTSAANLSPGPVSS